MTFLSYWKTLFVYQQKERPCSLGRTAKNESLHYLFRTDSLRNPKQLWCKNVHNETALLHIPQGGSRFVKANQVSHGSCDEYLKSKPKQPVPLDRVDVFITI